MSNINYISINENFPVAGQDNDTQVFRDNFDTIKTSLRVAKEEITTLQDDSASLTADVNDFNLNIVRNAIAVGIREQVLDRSGDSGNTLEIAWDAGSYHVCTLRGNTDVLLTKMPGDLDIPGETSAPTTAGRLILELYSDVEGSGRTLNFVSVKNTEYKKSEGFPATVTVTSSTNPIIIEAWRRSTVDGKNYIFLRYLGQFV